MYYYLLLKVIIALDWSIMRKTSRRKHPPEHSLFQSILSKGYFPDELPPCFSTEDFSNAAKPLLSEARAIGITKSCRHNMVRAGTLRRRLSLPNPSSFSVLADLLEDNWAEITNPLDNSNFSLSKPQIGGVPHSRAIGHSTDLADLPTIRAKQRAQGKYLLVTDISQFYQSIYLHTIPWILHGKAKAKRKRDDTLLGNILDKTLRNGQDGQTIGLPIGPDTSMLVAELILSDLDKEISTFTRHGFRFIDDFEFSFERRSDAEACLSRLQEYLSQVELDLNPHKTYVAELPFPIGTPWKRAISDHSLLKKDEIDNANELISFFDLAFGLRKDSPNDFILNFAVARLSSLHVSDETVEVLVDLLCQSVMVEPGLLRKTAKIFLHLHYERGFIRHDALSAVLAHVVSTCASHGCGDETAWALWLASALDIELGKDVVTTLGAVDDPLVITLSSVLADQGKLPSSAFSTFKVQAEDELRGTNWLAAYELSHRGLCGTTTESRKILQNSPYFSSLSSQDISFLHMLDGEEALKLWPEYTGRDQNNASHSW